MSIMIIGTYNFCIGRFSNGQIEADPLPTTQRILTRAFTFLIITGP